MIRKNEIYTATVTGMTADGSGVVRINDFAVFVPGTALGDTAEIKIVKVLKHYGFGILHQIITPSSDREENDCSVYKQCGGCCWRHISYEAELQIKWQHVRDTFRRLGGIELEPQPICGSEQISGYRNKAQFPVRKGENGKPVAGFFAKRSHRVIPCSECHLQPPTFNKIVAYVLDFMEKHRIEPYDEELHQGLVRHIYLRQADATKEIMLCLVCTAPSFALESAFSQFMSQHFPEIKSIVLNYNPQKTNVILGKQCRTLWGSDFITDILCGVKVHISPLSFYQVNKRQAERLYRQGIEYCQLQPDDTLLDLYCGIGTIGLTAANQVKTLIGVEIIPQAVENAKENAAINQFTNTRFLCDDCKGAVKQLESEGIHPSAIIVDPPRKGCDEEVIESIRRFAPQRLVMISCNPATAARDCKRLSELGYTVQEYCPFDLFPRTSAVECVVKLRLDPHHQ